jgi:hypothetical protein
MKHTSFLSGNEGNEATSWFDKRREQLCAYILAQVK